VAAGLVLPCELAVELPLSVRSPLSDAEKEALAQPVCKLVLVAIGERVGERVYGGDSDGTAEREAATEDEAAPEGVADAVAELKGDAEGELQADTVADVKGVAEGELQADTVTKDVASTLSEDCTVGEGLPDSVADTVSTAVGVASGEGLAVCEPAAAVAERAGEGVPRGEAVGEGEPTPPEAERGGVEDPAEEVLCVCDGEGVPAPLPLRAAEGEKKEAVKDAVPHAEKLPAPPLAVALFSVDTDGVAHGEAGIDAELAPDTVALSVFPGDSEGTTEGEPE
jgi:hypothetical protein